MNLDFTTIRAFANDRRALRRTALAAATLVFTMLAMYLAFASNAKQTRAQDANQRGAWNTVAISNAALPLDNFVSTWAAKRSSNAEQTSLNWIVRDTRDLRQSLLALDATRVVVQRISVTKRDADFTVSAEVAP
jgi:hypothetical protein